MIKTHSNLKQNLQKPYRSLRKTNGKQMNTMENQRTAKRNQRKPKESLRKTWGVRVYFSGRRVWRSVRVPRVEAYAQLTRTYAQTGAPGRPQVLPLCVPYVFFHCISHCEVSYLRPCGGGSKKTSSSPNLKSSKPKKKKMKTKHAQKKTL